MSNESRVVVVSDDDCDESKCVTWNGKSVSDPFDPFPFTCYSNDGVFPMACTNGYKPQIVANEPTILREVKMMVYDKFPQQYFTCCPPDLSSNVNVSRHCSDPNSTSCDEDSTRPYARQMAKYLSKEPFMCCDSILDNSNNKTTNLLDDTECVPYRSEIYFPALALNSYGRLMPVSCNNKGIYSEFRFPRKVEKENPYGIFHYECCVTESTSKLPTFIRNAAFKKTVYSQIIVSTVAVFSCTMMILALSIPLFLHLKKQRTQASSKRRNRRAQRSTEPVYSSYVLYLVYLAIPDLLLNLYFLGVYVSYANGVYNPNFHGLVVLFDGNTNGPFGPAFVVACSNANLYVNCVISNEILTLLRNCHNSAISYPPSYLKVTLQAIVVYLFSIIVFVIYFFIDIAQNESYRTNDSERFAFLKKVNLIWSIVISYTFPVLFFGYVWITIWYRGYMPSVEGKMKQLAWYFLRIFIVFYLIWLPGMSFVLFGAAKGRTYAKIAVVGYLFCAIQPIVSTCLAMMKSDVRNYTRDLITLSYIRKVPDATSTGNDKS